MGIGFNVHGFLNMSIIGNVFRIFLSICLLIVIFNSGSYLESGLALVTLVVLLSTAGYKFYISRDEERITVNNVKRVIFLSMWFDICVIALTGCEGLDVQSFVICAVLLLFVFCKSKFVDALEKGDVVL